MCGTEGDLLHLGKVVGWIAIQHHFANGNQRIFLLGPHLGQIEWIVLVLLGLIEGHDLNVHAPAGIFASLDGIVQIANAVVGIAAGQFVGALHIQVLDALIGLEVEFGIGWLTLGIDQLEGVRAIAVHVTKTIGNATIAEQEADLKGNKKLN